MLCRQSECGDSEEAGGGEEAAAGTSSSSAAANAGYLAQKLVYSADGSRLLDAEGEAVMMGWEAPLMERHAAAICQRPGGADVLNVGFGLGLVDEAIQRHAPRSHTIIEAHPDVYVHVWEQARHPLVQLLLALRPCAQRAPRELLPCALRCMSPTHLDPSPPR